MKSAILDPQIKVIIIILQLNSSKNTDNWSRCCILFYPLFQPIFFKICDMYCGCVLSRSNWATTFRYLTWDTFMWLLLHVMKFHNSLFWALSIFLDNSFTICMHVEFDDFSQILLTSSQSNQMTQDNNNIYGAGRLEIVSKRVWLSLRCLPPSWTRLFSWGLWHLCHY